MIRISPMWRCDDRGLTLTELVVTLALFGLVMGGVVTLWGKTQEAYFVGSAMAESEQNVRAAIDFMVREIRAAGRDVTVCTFDYGVAGGGDPGDCTDAKRDACRCKINLPGVSPCPSSPPSSPYNTCANVFAIPAGEATLETLRILADRNEDGVIDATGDEDVTYALSTASPPCPAGVPRCITRQTGTTTTAMVAVNIAVDGFRLRYFPVPGYGPCSPVQDPCPGWPPGATLTQLDADRIGRIEIKVTASQTFAGQTINRTLVTDVMLRNRS
jgi:prepilin-type N-terminal cleavage/methylation domain-containing protein